MPAKGWLERIEAGVYCSRNNRVKIKRQISRQTNHADEVCWSVTVDGVTQVMHEDTFRDAKVAALRVMEENDAS